MQISLKNYKKLLTKIRQTISKAKKNIVQSVDYQKVLMSWEIGKEIDLHLKGQDKAEYGEQLFLQLTKDLGIEKTTLYQMRTFYKSYPKIPAQNNSLSWSHYRSLIAVKDVETRQQLEDLVIEKSLGSDRLQREIGKTKKQKKIVKKSSEKIPQLKVKRGKLFTYTKTKEGKIDLGFSIFLSANYATLRQAQHDSAVMLSLSKREFTYLATLERVVDGDTLHVKIELGFGIQHHEILRLAKIEAEEVGTKNGEEATKELKEILKDLPFLVLKTNRTDTYGRYIADVFIPKNKSDSPEKVAAEGVYLNQLLLDRGLVSLYE